MTVDISQVDGLTDEDRAAVGAAAQVVRQLAAALEQVPCPTVLPVRVGLAPDAHPGPALPS